MARLAVFDIDGTLCDTNAVDDSCFVKAVAEFLGVEHRQIDWCGAPHITDSGLLDWLCAVHGRPLPVPSEIRGLIDRFLDLLALEAASAPEHFAPIPGACNTLASLAEHQWDIAVATGGWMRAAEFKLSGIGLDPGDFALATADDAKTRVEIVRAAVRRAEARYARTYTRVVSIGDATWDVRTAAELGFPFIGIARGERASCLRELGAATILDDLSDLRAVCTALDVASVPNLRRASVSA